MSNTLSAAVQELQEQLDQQLRDVAETKKMINALRKRMGEAPLYEDVVMEQGGTIRPDQYYGKAFAAAAQEYLERRKQATSAEEIMAGLQKGGFDFDAVGWKEKTRLRNVAISLAKNSQKFHKLPNGTFGLVTWYDAAMIRKARDTKEAATELAEEQASAEQ
jgi:hypothetical protein